MRKRYLSAIVVALCTTFTSLFAQKTTVLSYNYLRTQRNFDVALGAGECVSLAFAYQNLYSVHRSQRLKIGFGVRANNFFSGRIPLTTAPARLTSQAHSFSSLFANTINANIDTLNLSKTALTTLNFKWVAQYSFKRLDVGFNIDLIGLSFGPKQTSSFLASESALWHQTTQTARPFRINALLVGDSDYGSLNSELFVRYWLNDRFGLRLGISYQFVEYQTAQKLTFNNDRFRYKVMLPFVALTYSSFKMMYKDTR
jgi:hypothetical protein